MHPPHVPRAKHVRQPLVADPLLRKDLHHRLALLAHAFNIEVRHRVELRLRAFPVPSARASGEDRPRRRLRRPRPVEILRQRVLGGRREQRRVQMHVARSVLRDAIRMSRVREVEVYGVQGRCDDHDGRRPRESPASARVMNILR